MVVDYSSLDVISLVTSEKKNNSSMTQLSLQVDIIIESISLPV